MQADGSVAMLELRRGSEYRIWSYDLDIQYASLTVHPGSPDDRMRRIVELVRSWPGVASSASYAVPSALWPVNRPTDSV